VPDTHVPAGQLRGYHAVARGGELDCASDGDVIDRPALDLVLHDDLGERPRVPLALLTVDLDLVRGDHLALLRHDRDDVHAGARGKGNKHQLAGSKPVDPVLSLQADAPAERSACLERQAG